MLHCGGSGGITELLYRSRALCSTDVIMLDVVISLMFEACDVLFRLAAPTLSLFYEWQFYKQVGYKHTRMVWCILGFRRIR
jgi:hypothetical protein